MSMHEEIETALRTGSCFIAPAAARDLLQRASDEIVELKKELKRGARFLAEGKFPHVVDKDKRELLLDFTIKWGDFGVDLPESTLKG